MKSKYRKYDKGGPVKPKKKQKVYKERLDSIFSDPVAFDTYLTRLSDQIRGGEKATDSVYFDPYVNRYWSAVKYEDGEYPEAARRVDDRHDYFDLLPKNYDNSKSSKSLREGIIQLPPKLPFNSMNLSKPPALRRVLPEFYSRKMDASGTKVIYETSEGRVVKKKGPDSAQYERLNRAAINRMRQNR